MCLRVVGHLIARILHHPEAVVVAYLGLKAVLAAHPVDGLALYLHVAVGLSRLGVGDELSMNLHNVAISILHHTFVDVLRALDDIAVL